MSNKATAASQIHYAGFQMMKHLTLRLCYGFQQGTRLHHPPERVGNNFYIDLNVPYYMQFTFPQMKSKTLATPCSGGHSTFLVDLWKTKENITLYTQSQHVKYFMMNKQRSY